LSLTPAWWTRFKVLSAPTRKSLSHKKGRGTFFSSSCFLVSTCLLFPKENKINVVCLQSCLPVFFNFPLPFSPVYNHLAKGINPITICLHPLSPLFNTFWPFNNKMFSFLTTYYLLLLFYISHITYLGSIEVERLPLL
jgi:hypothetical protein